ncbi:MAG: hypothetical protein IPL35_02605 [Sphingobacteriales bacterium]|nr:hypothetical protein [Sphingobacteriales bacterium]
MILERHIRHFKDFETQTFVSTKQLLKLFDKRDEYKNDLLSIFKIDPAINNIFQIGNCKQLLSSINSLDNQCEKIDLPSKIRDIQVKKLLENEKALFEVFNVKNPFILKNIKKDLLTVESRYSAKNDLLEYYNLSKFANYLRDNEYDDLVNTIKEYLKVKNSKNDDSKNLRLLYHIEENKFYFRALTSTNDYKDFGINFSAFVAIVSLSKFVDKSKETIYIDNYSVDDSNIYVSFSFQNKHSINSNLTLSFNLILENDEVKRNAVAFNGLFKLEVEQNNKKSEIFLKPKGLKKEDTNIPVDLLTYPHRGNVKSVYEKIEELPTLIEFFIKQVSQDAKTISKIESPDEVRKFILYKIGQGKKSEFQVYKDAVKKKLASISVNNTFKLFELLRQVEDLFENDDIISRNYWRSKLYEALIEKK